MIFVTVGTSKLQFNRLLAIIDELCIAGIIDESRIVAQIGYSTYKPIRYKTLKFVDNDQHHSLLENSEYVITHAGSGSIITSLKAEKKVIVFPRLKEYGEHSDDHQLELTDFFSSGGFVLCAKNKIDLSNCISQIDTFLPKKFMSNNHFMNQMIVEYIVKNVI